jgi:hypothetical protein
MPDLDCRAQVGQLAGEVQPQGRVEGVGAAMSAVDDQPNGPIGAVAPIRPGTAQRVGDGRRQAGLMH